MFIVVFLLAVAVTALWLLDVVPTLLALPALGLVVAVLIGFWMRRSGPGA